MESLSEYTGIIVGVGYCHKELVVRVVLLAFSFATSVTLLPHPYPSNNSSRFTWVFPDLFYTSQGSPMLSSIYDVPSVTFCFKYVFELARFCQLDISYNHLIRRNFIWENVSVTLACMQVHSVFSWLIDWCVMVHPLWAWESGPEVWEVWESRLNNPISTVPPWPVLWFLTPGSWLEFLLQPSLMMNYNCKLKHTLFCCKLLWSHCLS